MICCSSVGMYSFTGAFRDDKPGVKIFIELSTRSMPQYTSVMLASIDPLAISHQEG